MFTDSSDIKVKLQSLIEKNAIIFVSQCVYNQRNE